MIVRAALFFIVFALAAFSFYWMVFRTKFFNAARIAEIVKTGLIVLVAVLSAAVALGFVIIADKIL